MTARFSDHVCRQLGFYVYRLIDPRNGETFYVGKGTGNRVFSHAAAEAQSDEDELSDKLDRIREIRRRGFEVAHVIHRHGMTKDQALEVEAALIDAYPEAANLVARHGSDERGVRHCQEIVEQYEAPEATFMHSAVVITTNPVEVARSSVYEQVRYAWKLDPGRAGKMDLVLAVERGLIVGVFVADQSLPATPENFPGTLDKREGRWGFIGREADASVAKLYVRKRLPGTMRRQGAANPVRYVIPSGHTAAQVP